MTWWVNLSKRAKALTLWCGAFSALVAAFFSFGQAMTASEPWHPATRGYVREAIDKTSSAIMASQAEGQIETIEVRRQILDKEMFELEMMLGNQAAPIPDAVRTTLQLRKRALDDDRKTLEYRFDQLQRARSGRRP